jgi:exopolyphosphatase/guanosine-5'-triphosphate,3'-diphosphate pyrophosphatase
VPIIPRWEWRAFDSRFGTMEDSLPGPVLGSPQESDELYLLSSSSANVKIRDARMDIKVLRAVNNDGLQQWLPILHEGFPLPAADVSRVFEALGLPCPPRNLTVYSLDRFLGDLVDPLDAIRTVRVHKRRARASIGGCVAEFTDVAAGGRSTRTIAIESENPIAVMAAVRAVGLGGYVNTSYPRGLAALVDDQPDRYAVIDVGTNSVKFHVGERGARGNWRTVIDRADVTRLGEGLALHGAITDEALERTAAAIAGMVEEATRASCHAIVAVGTAGLRIATNGADVVAAIGDRTGIAVEVISGDEEGRLAYLAAQAGLGRAEGSLVVFDTGGGSSQFTFGQGSRVDERFSLEVGAARYTERFGLAGEVTHEVLRDAFTAISADLSRLDGRPAPDIVVALGGAVTNMAAVHHRLVTYDPDVIHGSVLDRAEIDRQIEEYRSRGVETRRAIVGLQPKRADVILAGACIVRTIMQTLGHETITVSDRGLRHGLLSERFGIRSEPDTVGP